VQELERHAAEEQAGQGGVSPASDDDEVRADPPRLPRDDLRDGREVERRHEVGLEAQAAPGGVPRGRQDPLRLPPLTSFNCLSNAFPPVIQTDQAKWNARRMLNREGADRFSADNVNRRVEARLVSPTASASSAGRARRRESPRRIGPGRLRLRLRDVSASRGRRRCGVSLLREAVIMDRRTTTYRDRRDAGRELAEHLLSYAGRDVLVLGIPRGVSPSPLRSLAAWTPISTSSSRARSGRRTSRSCS